MREIAMQSSMCHASADFAHRRMNHRSLGVGGYGFGGPRLRAETPVRNVSAKVGTSACRHGLARGAPFSHYRTP